MTAVFLWFLGVSFVFVWNVFRSPALDYRLVLLGSVLPLLDVVAGGPRVLHTLAFTVVALLGVVVATRGRRLRRRRWIGVPIGLLLHLVLDGVWAETAVFWWPALGAGFPDGPLPELDHAPVVAVVLELLGAAALAWCWSAFGLRDPDNRRLFLRTGRLDRDAVSP